MMANLDCGLTHTRTHRVLSLGKEISFGPRSVLRSFRKHINNMMLLTLEAENNYVEAPILLQKNSKLHIMKNLIQFFSCIIMPF